MVSQKLMLFANEDDLDGEKYGFLYLLEVIIKGKKTILLVDTGASKSFISEGWIDTGNDEFVETVENKEVRVVLTDGSFIESAKTFKNIEVIFGGRKLLFDFDELCLPLSCGYAGILGLDFFKKFSAMMHFGTDLLTIKHKSMRALNALKKNNNKKVRTAINQVGLRSLANGRTRNNITQGRTNLGRGKTLAELKSPTARANRFGKLRDALAAGKASRSGTTGTRVILP